MPNKVMRILSVLCFFFLSLLSTQYRQCNASFARESLYAQSDQVENSLIGLQLLHACALRLIKAAAFNILQLKPFT